MKLYSQKYTADVQTPINPTDNIAGFDVRPGLFDVNGGNGFSQRREFYRPYQGGNRMRTFAVS